MTGHPYKLVLEKIFKSIKQKRKCGRHSCTKVGKQIVMSKQGKNKGDKEEEAQ